MSEFVKNMVGYYTPYSKRKEFQADPQQQAQTPAAAQETTAPASTAQAAKYGAVSSPVQRAIDAAQRNGANVGTIGKQAAAKQSGGTSGGGTSGGGGTQETPTYTPSAMVQEAKAYLDGVISGRPGAFQSKYADQIAALYEQIMNRPKFQYDVNQDPLFQQYRNIYTQGGQQAMQDTLGSAAALTGGYGNSWGTTAGYQAYQNYLRQLNDKIPELEQRAFDRYTQEGQTLRDNLAMNMGLDDTDYGRYRDSMEDWQADRAYGRGAYENDRALDWEQWKYLDALARANSGGSGGSGNDDGMKKPKENAQNAQSTDFYGPPATQEQMDLLTGRNNWFGSMVGDIEKNRAMKLTGIADPEKAKAALLLQNLVNIEQKK